MANKILYIIILFSLQVTSSIMAQDGMPKNWTAEKIKGTRFIPYAPFSGFPFLSEKFITGEIEFSDGVKMDSLALRYSRYRDDLIYFNTAISAQIIIDKISLKSFSFIDENGIKRLFRHQYYDGFFPGDRYFEVLSDGDISLLVHRKVGLHTCSTYYGSDGKLKNMSYELAYNYYLYNTQKGYELIRLNRNSFLSKFDKLTQKTVKKILRKNNVFIKDEDSFVTAWNLIKQNGIKIDITTSKN